jgi:hypothetical protein
MIKKRALIYFLIMGFPIGLGAGASTMLELPQLPMPKLNLAALNLSVAEQSTPDRAPNDPIVNETKASFALTNFGAIHPVVVGVFTLLACTGILLAADQPHSARPDKTTPPAEPIRRLA